MTNIASVLKLKISRVARKEVRSEAADLQKQLKRTSGGAPVKARVSETLDAATPRQFSATRLAAHRSKLGLPATAYGKHVGMSGAAIYLWEQGKSRPSAEQLQRLVGVCSLGKRAALEETGR